MGLSTYVLGRIVRIVVDWRSALIENGHYWKGLVARGLFQLDYLSLLASLRISSASFMKSAVQNPGEIHFETFLRI